MIYTKNTKIIIMITITFLILTIGVYINGVINYSNEYTEIYDSLKKFNKKNNINDTTLKILKIDQFNKKNAIIISEKENFKICSIAHKQILKGWQVVSSTTNGFIKENSISYTSDQSYGIGVMIGIIRYNDKIKEIQIDNSSSFIIKNKDELIFYSLMNIDNHIKLGNIYVPKVSIYYKDGIVITQNAWNW